MRFCLPSQAPASGRSWPLLRRSQPYCNVCRLSASSRDFFHWQCELEVLVTFKRRKVNHLGKGDEEVALVHIGDPLWVAVPFQDELDAAAIQDLLQGQLQANHICCAGCIWLPILLGCVQRKRGLPRRTCMPLPCSALIDVLSLDAMMVLA